MQTNTSEKLMVLCVYFFFQYKVHGILQSKIHQSNIVQTKQICTNPYWHEAFQ